MAGNQMKCFVNTTPLLKYVMEKSLRLTEAQQKLLEETLKQPRWYMLGDPIVLQLTSNLIKLIGAKKVLDVGVYTGASALSAALAIPDDGKVYALDLTDEYLTIGRKYWEQDGVDNKINLILGPATETLQKLISNGESGTFDFAFIDADKGNYNNYYEMCLTLLRSGGVIAVDNTIMEEGVIREDSQIEKSERPGTRCVKALNDKLKDDPRINISYLPIGDGLTLCFKK